jgi:riboflavin-specific deaminase-like protein
VKRAGNKSVNTTRRPRPFVLINMAMTADGKIATANRAISSFGSRRDIEHLYELRATADAVMAGARTVDSGPVDLGTGGPRFERRRLRAGLARKNLRIIVTGSGSLDHAARIFRDRSSPLIILASGNAPESRLRRLRPLCDDLHVCEGTKIHFGKILEWLGSKWRVKRLLVEGGGDLNGALFATGLVDELHLTICPFLFGGRTAPTIAEGPGVRRLIDAARFRIHSMRRIGDELFLTLRR